VIGGLPRRIEGVDRIETLIIDDGSTDRTVDVAKHLGVDHIVRNGRNLGYARSFSRGLEASLSLGADIIVEMDGDNQHPGRDIPALVRPILENEADIVVGCRDVAGHKEFSRLKKFLQRFGSRVVRKLSHTEVPDTTSGFRAMNRAAAMRASVMNDFSPSLEMLIQAGRTGLKVDWVPISFNPMTRPSRLFRSIPQYVFTQLKTLCTMYVFYCPMAFFARLAAFFFAISLLLSSWVAYFLWFSGMPGKVKGGAMGLLLFTSFVSVICIVTGLLGSVLSGLRFLLHDHRVRIRNMELREGMVPVGIEIETAPELHHWADRASPRPPAPVVSPRRSRSTSLPRRRLILMNPPLRNVVSCATPDYVSRNTGHLPPIGLLYIQAAVEHSRHDSVFLDADLEGWDHRQAASEALRHDPDIVGIQAMTFTMPDAYLLAEELKQQNPDVCVVLGGPHPTIYPKETACLPAVDFAFAGEGEADFIRFLDTFADPEARAKLPGIAQAANGHATYTPFRGWLKDLDNLHLPARRSSRYKDYCSVLGKHNSFTVLISSRGCPFRCIFCNRMGREYRYHSAKYVLREMEDILSLGIRNIFIHDDTFTVNRKRVEQICQGIIDRGYDILWDARTRVDCVDESLLALMRKSGCRRLSFGVESGSPPVLKAMRKDIDLARVERVFRACRQEGITTLADFMLGNLGETREDVHRTLAFARRIRPDFVQYSICSPYPGTPLYQMALERNMYGRDVWREFARDPRPGFRSPVWTEHFTEQELVELAATAYRKFYMRPNFILKQMVRTQSLVQLKTMTKAAVGMLRA